MGVCIKTMTGSTYRIENGKIFGGKLEAPVGCTILGNLAIGSSLLCALEDGRTIKTSPIQNISYYKESMVLA